MHRLLAKTSSVEIGTRFGKRVVIGVEFWARFDCGRRWRMVVCRCDCGEASAVNVTTLRQGKAQACGRCAHHGRWRGQSRTSPNKKHPLYTIWTSMKARCEHPNSHAYADYGGRGIDICPEWSGNYIAFRDWCLANGWAKGLHIDRIDNDRGYSPENCRFVTVQKNQQNKRSSFLATAFGETKPVAAWVEDERCVVSYACLYDRIAHRQMNPEIAMTTGKMKTGKKPKLLATSVVSLIFLLLSSVMFAADKGPEDMVLVGPESAKIGESVRLRLDGLPNVELSKTMDQQLAWMSKIRVITSAPKGVTNSDYTLDQQLSIKVSPFQWTFALDFKATKPGDYVVLVDWNEDPYGLTFHRITVGGSVVPSPDPTVPVPTDPNSPNPNNPQKITQVTYVWEKDSGPIPRQVSAALQRINAERSGVVATEFEQNSPDGTGETPEQYRIALETAKKVGLPALIVQAGSTVVTVVKDPQTEASVMEVLK